MRPHPRERNERDRFLVDINSGGQRSRVAPSQHIHPRKDVGDNDLHRIRDKNAEYNY